MARYSNTTTGKSKSTQIRVNRVNKYNTTLYNKIPLRDDDMYIITQHGDRLDNLADRFYKDSRLWWYIAHANRLTSINLDEGISLRIPATLQYAE